MEALPWPSLVAMENAAGGESTMTSRPCMAALGACCSAFPSRGVLSIGADPSATESSGSVAVWADSTLSWAVIARDCAVRGPRAWPSLSSAGLLSWAVLFQSSPLGGQGSPGSVPLWVSPCLLLLPLPFPSQSSPPILFCTPNFMLMSASWRSWHKWEGLCSKRHMWLSAVGKEGETIWGWNGPTATCPEHLPIRAWLEPGVKQGKVWASWFRCSPTSSPFSTEPREPGI